MSFAPLPSSLCSLSPSFHRRFVVLEECGLGGSGFCLKVQRRIDGLICVAKVIAKDRVGISSMVRTSQWGAVPEGFKAEEDGTLVVPSEAYVLRRVRHGNVVSFYDLFADERFFYLVRFPSSSYSADAAHLSRTGRSSSTTATPGATTPIKYPPTSLHHPSLLPPPSPTSLAPRPVPPPPAPIPSPTLLLLH
jgi:hypothetical protein